MNCSIIYYIAYKTGYIQRNLNKKFSTIRDLEVTSTLAAVSSEDLCGKFSESLEKTDFVIVIGGLSTTGDRNVMTVLSDYFTESGMEVTFNKKVLNPNGGRDGYLIKSGSKYIVVMPDEPDDIDKMIGSELMKNIDISPNTSAEMPEPVRTHSIVFAPEPDYSLEQLQNRQSPNILLLVCLILGVAVVASAVVWILLQM